MYIAADTSNGFKSRNAFLQQQSIPLQSSRHTTVTSDNMAPEKVLAPAGCSPSRRPSTKWDEGAHKALCGALVDTLDYGGVSFRANSDVLVNSMADRGYPFSWEGIR